MSMSPQSILADRWSLPAKVFHWIMVIVIFALLGSGNYLAQFVTDVYEKLDITQIHKSFGFVAFVLVALRLIWRLISRAPKLPPTVPRWQVLASNASHVLLYVLMIVMPVSGWLYASASTSQELYGIKNMVFGLFEMYDPFVPGSKELQDRFHTVHWIAGRVLVGVLLLHIAAALKHHFIDRDNVLRRMWF